MSHMPVEPLVALIAGILLCIVLHRQVSVMARPVHLRILRMSEPSAA